MAATTTPTAMNGLRKAAVLLVQMGRDVSAKVLAQMREAEVEEVMAEIARLGTVDYTQAGEVIDEFYVLAHSHRIAGQGGMDFARDLLEASMGAERASELMDRLSAAVTDMPF